MNHDNVKIIVRGIVQGVGFRPFVYRLACRHGLSGTVSNSSDGVIIHACGEKKDLQEFIKEIQDESPPLAKVTSIYIAPSERPVEKSGFSILSSIKGDKNRTLVSPDVATCDNCLHELFDPQDRRYRYPFINCTNCGPRFSIIESLPYDRPRTTMKPFKMCTLCESEYMDPADRRFHAQPNCCKLCGPRIWLVDGDGEIVAREDKALELTAKALRHEKIVAVKGIGGFHLAADAFSTHSVELLRRRKRRPAKPLAVMVKDIEVAREFFEISREEEKLLTSPERPIVILRTKKGVPLSPQVSPGLKKTGVMLPYAPVHYLLFDERACPDILIMTSGNLTDEPIVTNNSVALRRLNKIADFFLLHNRKIKARVDDSVGQVIAGYPQLIRRSRGFTPRPIHLPWDLPPSLGSGADMKNTFCLIESKEAFLSQHIGDLSNPEVISDLEENVVHFGRLFDISPRVIAVDMHPDYFSTRFGKRMGDAVSIIQHHHAHGVSVMAEHGLGGKVIGVIADGTGYGPDFTVWGGEILVLDRMTFTRVGHLEHLLLPGGDIAAREIWRIALSALWRNLGERCLSKDSLPASLLAIPEGKRTIVAQLLKKKINTPVTSSCGRLFDAVAAILGLRLYSEYEGQAAMELESLAWDEVPSSCALQIEIFKRPFYAPVLERKNNCWVISSSHVVHSMVKDLEQGVSPAKIAFRFHTWLVAAIAKVTREVANEHGIDTIVLSGGCMQNRFLLEGLFMVLNEHGLRAFSGQEVPVNDGGLSLGQAVIGGSRYVSCNTHESN